MAAPAPPPAFRRTPGTLLSVSVFGVPVRFHITFLFLIALVITAGLSGGRSLASDAIFILALFLSVLLHESGHALAARGYGIRTTEIVMYPVGGVARLEREAAPKAELAIALAGPAVNLGLAALLWCVLATKAVPAGLASDLTSRMALANVYLATFNLIPAFPMDGGRVTRAALALWKGDEWATRVATRLGRGLAVLMALYGIVQVQFFLILIALLIFMAASHEATAGEGRALTHGVPVRAAMITEFHTLPHGSTLRDAAELLLATSQQDFPVLHAGRVIGLLDRMALVRGMASTGPDSYVAEFMDRQFPQLEPSSDLGASLPLLAGAAGCALVVEDDRLVGMLTRDNLAEFLMMRKLGLDPVRRSGGLSFGS